MLYSVIYRSGSSNAWKVTNLQGDWLEMSAKANDLIRQGYEARVRGVIAGFVQMTDDERERQQKLSPMIRID